MMSRGISMSEICEIMAEKWSVSPRTIENQYYQIVAGMKRLVEEGRAELRAKLMTQNDLVYKKSLEEGKYKVALDATMAQARLGGLFEGITEEVEMPSVIEIDERDFSTGPRLVGETAENE